MSNYCILCDKRKIGPKLALHCDKCWDDIRVPYHKLIARLLQGTYLQLPANKPFDHTTAILREKINHTTKKKREDGLMSIRNLILTCAATFFLLFLLGSLVGCNKGTTISPSSLPTTASNSTPPDPLPPIPGLASEIPVWVVSGNNNIEATCENAVAPPIGKYVWIVRMTDSGPRTITRVLSMVHHDHTAGCAPTLSNPRNALQVNAQSYYSPHNFGELQLTFDTKRFNCGRVQVDASFLDDAGKEWLIVGTVINYGTNCAYT